MAATNHKLRIRSGDTVVVISGRDKGTTGRVVRVLPGDRKVVVEGVARVRRHKKPVGDTPGGIVEKEMPIHVSNVMPVDPKDNKPTRVRVGSDKDGNKIRLSARSGASLDG